MLSEYKTVTQRANFVEIGFGKTFYQTKNPQLAETISVNEQKKSLSIFVSDMKALSFIH